MTVGNKIKMVRMLNWALGVDPSNYSDYVDAV